MVEALVSSPLAGAAVCVDVPPPAEPPPVEPPRVGVPSVALGFGRRMNESVHFPELRPVRRRDDDAWKADVRMPLIPLVGRSGRYSVAHNP